MMKPAAILANPRLSPSRFAQARESICFLDRRRHNSTNVEKIVTGVTAETMASDPVVDDYMRSNFPEHLGTPEEKAKRSKIINNWGELRRTAPKPPLNIRSLSALQRCANTEEGSNRCFPMRAHGFVPGLIYGRNPTIGIDCSDRIFVKTPSRFLQSEMDRYHHSFCSRVYDLTIYDSQEQMEAGDGGIVHRVLPRDVNQHPVNDMPYCCNFLRYHAGRPIKIPVAFINEEESPALKRDGFVIPINKFVECMIEEGVDIPEELEVECTGLQFKQVIRLDRVIFPDGVTPSKKVLTHNDFMIGPIHGGRSAADDEEGEGDEEAEG